jgi:ATP-binding cassette subfamily C (CFTR/MRP) protein 1
LIWLVRSTSEFETSITAVERIKEYCNTPHEADWESKENKITNEWPENGAIEFHDFSCRYRDKLELTLKNISFEVKSNEKVCIEVKIKILSYINMNSFKIGIVGRTGAGKSSMALALFRIIDAATGTITIDGIKINEIGLHSLREKMTIIPQVNRFY